MLEVADLYETSVCPLAKVMRRECRKRGIDSLKVVYSREPAMKPLKDDTVQAEPPSDEAGGAALAENNAATAAEFEGGAALILKAAENPARRSTPGSTSFVPSAAGLIIAGEAVNDLTRDFLDS